MQKSIFYAVTISLLLSGSSLASQVGELNTFVAGQTASAADVNENFDALKDAVNDNDTNIDSLSTSTTSNTNQINSLATTVNTLSNTTSTLNTTVSGHTTQISGLSTSVSTNTSSITSLDTDLSALQDTVGAIDVRVDTLENSASIESVAGKKVYSANDEYIGDLISYTTSDGVYMQLKNTVSNVQFKIGTDNNNGTFRIYERYSIEDGYAYFTTNDCTGNKYVLPVILFEGETNLTSVEGFDTDLVSTYKINVNDTVVGSSINSKKWLGSSDSDCLAQDVVSTKSFYSITPFAFGFNLPISTPLKIR